MEVKFHLHLYVRVLSWQFINCIYFQSRECCFCEPVTVQNHQWSIHGILKMLIFQFITLQRRKKRSQAVLLCFSMDSSQRCEMMENDEDTEFKHEDSEFKQAEQLSKQKSATHGNTWRWQIRRQKTHQEKENRKSITDRPDTKIRQNFK